MIQQTNLSSYGVQTKIGVFHSHSWNITLPENFFNILIEGFNNQNLSKIRFCLHPFPSEIQQVTYLAFKNPYQDDIHKHPHHNEVVVPLLGKAIHRTFQNDGSLGKEISMSGENPVPISTEIGEWHSVKVQSPYFVMVEIGRGPFQTGSTIYM